MSYAMKNEKTIKFHPLCDPDIHILFNRNILPLMEMLCFIGKLKISLCCVHVQ